MTPPQPHILYIDDDDGLRRLASKALVRRGYRVSLAATGPEGAAMARDDNYDLIAVDHYMPGQDGLATLAQIQAMPAPPPVVYVTGSEESSVAVAALKAGAADYVVKSVGEDFFDLLANAFAGALRRTSLVADKEAAEAAMRASNARLEALLGEVNHRVANSLQMVSAFVHMHAASLTGPAKAALQDTQRRIAAIAQVHRSLYTGGDVETVEMSEYLRAIVAELEQTWSVPGSPRTLRLTAAPLRLATDKAVSVGVIVNELVSNACKYAYPADSAGEVRIDLGLEGETMFRLSIEDDGCGFDRSAPARGTGLGTKLVGAMASSLRADLSYAPRARGVSAVLRAAV